MPRPCATPHPLLAAAALALLAAGCASPGGPGRPAAGEMPAALRPVVITAAEIPPRDILTSAALAGRSPDACGIILEAHLDDNLRNHPALLEAEAGEADGRLLLGDYITALNGRELVDFVKENGYGSFLGPVEIRKWPGGRVQVDVKIIGGNGQTMVLILEADGRRQGAG